MISLKYIATAFLVVAFTLFSYGQFVNNVWLWGRNHQDTSSFPWGATNITFNSNNISIEIDSNVNMNIKGTYSGLGTADGQYFIYTNGYAICNKNHDTISNGAGLTPGGNDSIYSQWGIPFHANAILLPYPGSDRLMAMISMNNFFSNYLYSESIFYNLIDPSGNNGNGNVMLKNQVVISDTFDIQGLSVTKHSNGRDWWIFAKRTYLNDFCTLLLTSNGISFQGFQSFNGPFSLGQGGATFSPNGRKFACFSTTYKLRVYEFDRCSGQLGNMIYKDITDETAGSVAFSPNSRYLYICKWDSLWQFDMEAPDIMASQTFIASIDLNTPDPLTGWISGWAYLYLAADGKIYLQNFSGVMLHVINNPDMPGQACNFVQNQIQCPTYYYSTVPTYVNLNLMQEHGSICDTLGVGYEKLIIKNEELKIAPNPSNGNINIEFPVQEISGMLYVYDVNGKQVYSEYVSPYTYIKNINLQGKLSSGMYALSMVFGEQRFLGKMVVN